MVYIINFGTYKLEISINTYQLNSSLHIFQAMSMNRNKIFDLEESSCDSQFIVFFT